jgi:hypothetical protein
MHVQVGGIRRHLRCTWLLWRILYLDLIVNVLAAAVPEQAVA